MKRPLFFVALSLLALAAGPRLSSQETLDGQLTLERAVQLALTNNPDLESSRLEMEKAYRRVSEAWANTLPSINFSGQYMRAIKKPVFFLPGDFFGRPGSVVAVEIGSTHSVSLGLTAQQILFNGAVFVGVGASQVYSDAATELYRGKQTETVAKTRKAFYAVLFAKEAVAMMRANLKNAEDNLKNVQLMRRQGILSEYEELRATVGVANLRPIVIQTENSLTLATSALSNTIGVPMTDSTVIVGALTLQPYDEELLRNANRMILESNTNIRALRLQKDVNEAFVSAERSSYLPTLVAFGNYQYQAQKNAPTISSKDLIASSTVGLQLSLNLFQGMQTNSRVDQAKIEVRKTESQIVSVENALRTALQALTGTLQQARQRVEAQAKTVEQADQGYRIVTARFLTNAATQLEVNDAQVALTQAKVNRMQAIYDYLVASADLDQLLARMPAYVTGNQ